MAENGAADSRCLLDIDAGNLDRVKTEDLVEGLSGGVRVVHGDGRAARERANQGPGRSGSARMGQRLVESVPSATIVEGLNPQGHDAQLIREKRAGPLLQCPLSAQKIHPAHR